MTTLNIILLLAAIALVAVVVHQIRVLRRGERRQKTRSQRVAKDTAERISQHRIAEKAAVAVQTAAEAEVDLSESGAISVGDEIDRCMRAGKWDDAIKWADHAIQSRPDHVEFKVKLAEVYYKGGYHDEFRQLLQELEATLGDEIELRARLSAMAQALVSGDGPASR